MPLNYCGQRRQPANEESRKSFVILRPMLIEQTAKKYKGMMLFGGLGILVGFFMVSHVPPLGVLVIVASLALLFFGRLGAWWHHG